MNTKFEESNQFIQLSGGKAAPGESVGGERAVNEGAAGPGRAPVKDNEVIMLPGAVLGMRSIRMVPCFQVFGAGAVELTPEMVREIEAIPQVLGFHPAVAGLGRENHCLSSGPRPLPELGTAVREVRVCIPQSREWSESERLEDASRDGGTGPEGLVEGGAGPEISLNGENDGLRSVAWDESRGGGTGPGETGPGILCDHQPGPGVEDFQISRFSEEQRVEGGRELISADDLPKLLEPEDLKVDYNFD